MMCARMDYISGKEGQKYFFSLALMIRKLNENGFKAFDVKINSDSVQCSYEAGSIKEALFKEFFFFVFVFIILLHYDSHYPSFNKL